MTIDSIAEDVLNAYSARRQIEPFSRRRDGLDLASAYRVTAAVRRLREARGERVVGRKIGFTNTTIWPEYDVWAPIWGYVYDSTTVRREDIGGVLPIGHLVEPRIEPEIMVRLSRAPEPGMDERALLSCIEWVAHGFEVVQSLFPGWRFAAADTVAAFALHGALLVGDRRKVVEADSCHWATSLASFETVLLRGDQEIDRGHARNVLGGGPLTALRHLVAVLDADPDSPPLAAGEIVSTGTLTRAMPIAAGETWSTGLAGLPLPGIAVTFT